MSSEDFVTQTTEKGQWTSRHRESGRKRQEARRPRIITSRDTINVWAESLLDRDSRRRLQTWCSTARRVSTNAVDIISDLPRPILRRSLTKDPAYKMNKLLALLFPMIALVRANTPLSKGFNA
jgi:hypothetical protein